MGKRRYAICKLCDLAQRPVLPEIDDAALADGSWAATLIALADGTDAVLADMLTHAWPPNANALRGQLSRSERLARLLHETIDRAAREVGRRLDRADEEPPTPTTAAQTPADQARAELAALGITP